VRPGCASNGQLPDSFREDFEELGPGEVRT
jgi:hypothetical protein